jgi:hypothetical protein
MALTVLPMALKASLVGAKTVTSEARLSGFSMSARRRAPTAAVSPPAMSVSVRVPGMVRTESMMWRVPPT